ncbi:hypothetical protein ACH5RR_023673 [Cinchona calisaya]|uniref:Uncharacterized protein n=1 Tax=Cinchona calisaya TaxID=153742 RepID=A0ABD2ZBC2_9GENT
MSGSGPLISLDHARIHRPIESACSWMLYRNPWLFLSQEVGNQVLSDDEKSFYLLLKTRNVGNVRRRLSVSDGQIPMVGISLKAQTERINGLLEGYLSHFSANQKDWSCWMLLSAAIT